MRTVLVWRHGETGHNATGRFQGHLDSELSEVGLDQARTAAAALAERPLHRIVTSDLQRASATADELAALVGLPAARDPRFREINVGGWQGLTHAEIMETDAQTLAALDRGEDPVRGGTGESVAIVGRRCREGFDALLETLGEGETAVVTTHGVAGRALVAEVIGLSHRDAWLMLVGLRNAHWAELVEHRTGWRLATWNTGVTDSLGSITDR